MNKVLTVPNCMSIGRIALIPVIILLILKSNTKNYPILLGLYFFSILLDFFDGFFARVLSQESELGKILDPIADKLMTFFIVIALIVKADFPIWLALVIVLRDILILIGAILVIKKKQKVSPSILIGKATFGVLGALVMIYIVDLNEMISLDIFKRFFIVLSFSFIIWSFVEYLMIYLKEKNARSGNS